MIISNIPNGVANHIRDGKHYFCEVSPDFDWKAFIKWAGENLPKYPVRGENCMGQTTYRESVSYGTSWKDGDSKNGLYVGFRTEKERTMFLAAFPEVSVPEIFKDGLYAHY